MSENTGQNFENHVKFPQSAFMVLGIALMTIIFGSIGLSKGNITFMSIGVITAGIGMLSSFIIGRSYCTKLQDRIIRTEMKIRLRDILDSELASRAEGLSTRQLVALRFGSDAELAGLVTKVLDDNISDLKTIKKMVTDWQGDYHRV